MAARSMPPRGHSTAPSFDASQPRELRRYFTELDILFADCNITDIALMKKHACRYLDIDSSEIWESLPEFTFSTDFDAFRLAVHALYPGSDDDRKYSISHLDKLVDEQLRKGIHDSTELGAYFRSFYNIAQYLRSKNRISDIEQSRAFARGFEPSLWTRIGHRLELKYPDHYPDDPHPIEDIHSAAKFVLVAPSASRKPRAPSLETSSPSS